MPTAKSNITPAARKRFLTKLGENANVTLSARSAKVAAARFYALRRTSKAFAAQWIAALTEDVVRIEAELIAFLLAPIDPTLSDKEIRLMMHRHRIAMMLIRMHGPTVRGAGKPAAPALTGRLPTQAQARAEMLRRLEAMRDRLPKGAEDDDDGLAAA